MRRTIPYAVAVVATLVAVLAVMGVPGLSFGQGTVIHGGSPSDVYMLREPTQEGCVPDRVTIDGVSIMPLQIDLAEPSHVLVSFSFDVAGLDSNEKVVVGPRLDGSSDDFEWLFYGSSRESAPGSVTSVFPDQEVGTHYVDIYAELQSLHGYQGRLDAGLGTCVLTVFVIPAAA
jgi:hypothetical protein